MYDMNTEIIRKFYRQRGLGKEETENAVKAVERLARWLEKQGMSLDDASLGQTQCYVEDLVEKGESDEESMLALSRYFYLIGRYDIYIYMARVVGGVGVIDSIKSRTGKIAGEKKAAEIFEGLAEPPLGTPAEKRPGFISRLMDRMNTSLESGSVQRILAGNNHGIPASSIDSEKQAYEAASSLDEYLKQRHARKVAELQEHCDSGKVWFEQVITQDVVDFVAANQEILSAVRQGSTLYVTKIPYDIVSYLKETDSTVKRYCACHCPFVRESIITGEVVTARWCYCSGGFAKFPFEQVLGIELEVKLEKSVLAGDDICRFAIDIGQDFK